MGRDLAREQSSLGVLLISLSKRRQPEVAFTGNQDSGRSEFANGGRAARRPRSSRRAATSSRRRWCTGPAASGRALAALGDRRSVGGAFRWPASCGWLAPATGERRALRAQLSVRGALVETRAKYVTTIRGLARAAGVLLPTCSTETFAAKFEAAASLELDAATRTLFAPLVAVLQALEVELARVKQQLAALAQRDPIIGLFATVPGGAHRRRDVCLRGRRGQAFPQRAMPSEPTWGWSPGGRDGRPGQAPPRQHHQAGQHDDARHVGASRVADSPLARIRTTRSVAGPTTSSRGTVRSVSGRAEAPILARGHQVSVLCGRRGAG
jgi:hypothetical protein